MKLLIVEDEKKTGEYLTKGLTEAGFVVDLADNGLNGYHLAMTGDYDLIILDIMLPDVNGWDIVRMLRSANKGMPILLLTALGTIEHRVKGLELGADDYLVKPFHMSELLARIRAVLRRKNQTTENALTNGLVTVNVSEKTATVAGDSTPIVLSRREYALLAALLARPGTILSRRRIEERIYEPGEEPESNAVEYLIHSLRKKLGPSVIKNVRGLGWMVEKGSSQ